jgi:hypothetical protein
LKNEGDSTKKPRKMNSYTNPLVEAKKRLAKIKKMVHAALNSPEEREPNRERLHPEKPVKELRPSQEDTAIGLWTLELRKLEQRLGTMKGHSREDLLAAKEYCKVAGEALERLEKTKAARVGRSNQIT